MDVNNQGLNIPSNLQNLDVRNELLSKEVGSGVNCAYSLRDLTGNNLDCVRVRRMPEDSTSSGDTNGNLNDEKIFPAQAVASREVEDWVNGKLETTLPLDVATGSAAYSLRKVKASYSGDAVRIRRSSDDIEVDVAFDSDNKVSASSAITNVAEQGGESGQTTDTTLGDFINGTDAFVHTWYDQAGSNDAVQETANNQPAIAENGALLADGIDFDGSDDFLQTSTQVLTGTETGANSMYVVLKQTSGDAGYICGSASNQSGVDYVGQSLYGNNADSVFVLSNGNNIDEPERDNITITQNSTVLVSANYSNNNTNTLNKNANNNGYANGTSAYDFNAGSNFTIGARDGSTATAVMFDGSIKEIIAYDSDQTDNRFKIESNINNYYGLYNDANAFSANAQVDGTGSTVSNASKDGGTLTLSSASGNNYLYFQLTETVPATSGDIFISFNYESSDDSVNLNNVKLRDDADNAKSGDLVDSSGSAITIQKNGFYSGKLASANLTNTGTRLAFLTNQTTDGYTFTISNLRYSRIARNGFVETWYDQSGNNKHLSQTSAGNQPKIVLNGGQDITDGLHFDNDQTLGENTGGTPTQSSAFFTFVAKLDASTTRPTLAGGNADIAFNATPDVLLRANSSNTRTATSSDVNIIVGQRHLISVEVTSLTPTVYVDDGSHTLADLTANLGASFKILGGDTGINATYGLDGRMNEAIAFDGDKSADVSAIRLEQNNYYNIY